jgi:hypothetical protein
MSSIAEVPGSSAVGSRILFLDDDPQRAMIFLQRSPEAVWVQTAESCIERLAECWDEVHLDHDLGGERFVDHEREDCGMAVIRWLGLEPRPHLQGARFVVHSHNTNAACIMAVHLQVMGFVTDVCPFGVEAPARGGVRALAFRLASWLRRLLVP